ncbi:phosphatase PAP2 family protein [Streptomyces ziwulingensis]|uniref:Phosphatidic acid phosphatase type 2/haloperoxidase domain-containing protein n=1 Tax=Streptomyces ziwulingensis TaxID=1045501 RepID=A0ABP9ATQ8_9ACTN
MIPRLRVTFLFMNVEAEARRVERRPVQWVAGWETGWIRRSMPVIDEAAERTKLWWGAAGVLALCGGARGRRAALSGLASMALAEVASNAGGKPLWQRRRPPAEWIPHDDVHDRPDSSSFPSGHTAAAFGFTGAVAAVWPAAGVVCAAPALAVAVQRVHSGAHYPSDVAVGAGIGTAAAWAVHRLPRLLRKVIL